jgi:hypothetical protein
LDFCGTGFALYLPGKAENNISGGEICHAETELVQLEAVRAEAGGIVVWAALVGWAVLVPVWAENVFVLSVRPTWPTSAACPACH